MGRVGILTEKPSAGRNFGKALGGKSGQYKGEDFIIVSARGHLYEFADPIKQVPASKASQYKSWELSDLPWDEKDFEWIREQKPDTSKEVNEITNELSACDEIVIASDIDPTGEGDLLAWEIIDELNLHHKKFSRMEFTDESAPSLQKAFENRRPVVSMNDEGGYRKAQFRSQFDMLSMQWTRMASKVLESTGRKALLRNGRLKSAMVVLVGDQLKAHNSYVKKPKYMARFVDDHDVTYTNPEAAEFDSADQVDLSALHSSSVTKDGESDKKTAPPKLLDLAGLSAMLAKKGVGAKDVLKVYQKMYEAQIVSYPRTEDKTVTNEQFKELLPKVDQIAAVVGVDPAKLNQRSPRKSHVQDKGAHGANRPGTNVPGSLDAVEKSYGKTGRYIYETLAKNYLTMLAEDYVYTQHKGHVTDFPEFTGIANVPKVQGWKDIFTVDAELADDEDEMSSAGLGSTAESTVGEKINPRPAHPSMAWLMKQLERHDVGTGATRTSTYADVSGGAKALMREAKNKLTLTETGQVNYTLLPGTKIGDLEITKKIYADMKDISDGKLTGEAALAPVKDWILDDIKTMEANAKNITDDMGSSLVGQVSKPKATGFWVPGNKEVKFNKSYSGHDFTDDEIARLLAGEKDMVIDCVSSNTGKSFQAKGGLEEQTFQGDNGPVTFVGFKGIIPVDTEKYIVGDWVEAPGKQTKFKRTYLGYRMSDDEGAKLLAGESITFTVNDKTFTGKIENKVFESKDGKIKYVGFTPEIDTKIYAVGEWVKKPGVKTKFKRVWSGHTFTEKEIQDLLAGKAIEFDATGAKGLYRAKGNLDNISFTKDGKTIQYVGFNRFPFEKKKK